MIAYRINIDKKCEIVPELTMEIIKLALKDCHQILIEEITVTDDYFIDTEFKETA